MTQSLRTEVAAPPAKDVVSSSVDLLDASFAFEYEVYLSCKVTLYWPQMPAQMKCGVHATLKTDTCGKCATTRVQNI
jgi:hypothetical protein